MSLPDPDDCYSTYTNPEDTPAPAIPAATPTGEYPIPAGFTRVSTFNTAFVFWDRFETNYATGSPGPSLRWDNTTMTKRDMLAGYEFKIGPRHGVRGDDAIEIKFPRCKEPRGERGSYIAHIGWHVDGSNSEAGVGSEWPHPDSLRYDFNTDNPTIGIGNIIDNNWHGFLCACYNNSAGNVVLKVWYNAQATGNIQDYVYLGSSIDTSGQLAPAPKMPFASEAHSGGTHPLQIRIDEIPSNDEVGGEYHYPSTNFELRNMFTCEIREGAPTSAFLAHVCPPGQHYDPLQNVCIIDAGSAGTTTDGIVLPSLPTPNYSLDPIDYDIQSDHNANGSFREHFLRGDRDLNSVMIGGYFKTDGPDDEEITAKLGGGVQTSSNAGIAGRCYNIHIALDGNSISLQKEARHGEYHDTGIQNYVNMTPRQGHYTGVIFMKANIIWLGDPAVRLTAWMDTEGMADNGIFTASKQNWVQVLDAIDTGYWYERAWITGAVPGDSIATIRVDQQEETSYDCKFCFCARIKGGPAY